MRLRNVVTNHMLGTEVSMPTRVPHGQIEKTFRLRVRTSVIRRSVDRGGDSVASIAWHKKNEYIALTSVGVAIYSCQVIGSIAWKHRYRQRR